MSDRIVRTGATWVAAAAVLLTSACGTDTPPPRAEAPAPPASASPSPAAAAEPSAAPPVYKHDYVFTEDWFSERIANWVRFVGPYAGRPHLEYLEIGVFEGRSALWMLDYILTDPSSHLTGVDLFVDPKLRERYLANVAKSGRKAQTTTITGYSQIELRKLPIAHYDIIYVDGSHLASDVMADAVLSWWLLKEGGLIIFDDYAWRGWSPQDRGVPPMWPAELTPRFALDPFLTAFSGSLEVVHRGYQLMVRKTAPACGSGEACTVMGPNHRYFWEDHALKTNDGKVVELSKEERALIEQIARTRSAGDLSVKVPDGLKSDARLEELRRRINLGL
jgi:hypothetical protein